ncbi:hypothetical protein ACS5NO_18520 [Larkinella sp. GY13]
MSFVTVLSRLCLLAVFLFLLDCKPASREDDSPKPRLEPGFGKSKERPVGTPFVWPKGITLIGKPGTDYDCQEEAGREREYGNGGAVMLCLNFYNTTNQPITIQLPPGLLFISKSGNVQNGILPSRVSIEVPAKERYLALLFLYCVNIDRETSTPGDEFEEQPILTRHPGMEQLYQLLANKKANFEDYPKRRADPNTLNAAICVTSAVHSIAEGKPIREKTLQQIQDLPNKY